VTPSMQLDHHECAVLRQLRLELTETLQNLTTSMEGLERARRLCSTSMDEQVAAMKQLTTWVRGKLESTEEDIRKLETAIGDGFDEPAITEFLAGAVDRDVVEEKIHGLLGVDSVKKLSDLVLGVDGAEDMLGDLGFDESQVQAVLTKLVARQRQHCKHMYDIHAVIVYQGRGQAGHYICFVRQPDGAFICFDDEQVSELADVSQVRRAIADRGTDFFPAVVRTLVYRRRATEAHPTHEAIAESSKDTPGAVCAHQPLHLPGPGIVSPAPKYPSEARAAMWRTMENLALQLT